MNDPDYVTFDLSTLESGARQVIGIWLILYGSSSFLWFTLSRFILFRLLPMNTYAEKSPKNSLLASLTFNWVVLLSLTLVAVVLSQLSFVPQTLIFFTLIMTVFKSQIVVDRFMGLRDIDIRWRALMLSYIVVIPAIIMLIYSSAPSI